MFAIEGPAKVPTRRFQRQPGEDRTPTLRRLVVPSLFLAVFTVAGCGDGSDPTLLGADKGTGTRNTLAIVPPELSLTEGESVALRATLTGPSALVFDASRVLWSSDDEKVASVGPSGVVTALRHGQVRVKAAYGNLAATASASVQGIPRALEAVGAQEYAGTVGRPLEGEISVRVLDKERLPLPNVEVHFEILSGGGEAGQDSTVSDQEGYARAVWILGPDLGRQELQASIADLPRVTFVAQAVPDYLTARVVKSVGDGQEAEVATLLPDPLQIQVVDTFGHPLPGVPIRWTFLSGGGSTLEPSSDPSWDPVLSTVTDENGRDRVYWRLGPKAGVQEAVAGVDTTSTGSSGVGSPSAAPRKYNPASERFQATGKPGKPKSVVVTPSSLSIPAGATLTLSAQVLDQFGNQIEETDLTWSTDSPVILSVDQAGVVEALQPGSGTVTASEANLQGTATIQVTAPTSPQVSRVEITPTSAVFLQGESRQFRAEALDQSGTVIVTGSPVWSSSDPEIFSVDDSGLATGVSPGSATLSATVEGVTGAAALTIEAPSGPSGPLSVVPGLRGFGVTTPAGRGGAILRVTNLDDSGPGSLRAALASPGPRTIIFDVGGTIVLSRDLQISDPFVTVAGQTAPSPGITLRGAGLKVFTHDVLVQHLRIRVGDDPSGPDPENRDAFQILGPNAHHVVLDHISASWAIDEVASTWYPLADVTISHSIIAEGLHDSLHPEGPHSCGLLIGDGSQRVAVIGNFLAHNHDRNPILKGNTATVVVNNLIYDPGYRSIRISDSDGSGPSIASIVGNVLVTGPSTENDYLVSISSDSKTGTRVFLSDNLAPTVVRVSEGLAFNPLVDTPPLWVEDLSPRPAAQVTDWVLGAAGARPSDRDAVDRRVAEEARTGGGRIVDSQDDVGGWPVSAPAYRVLELPPDPAGDSDGDGYTNLEEWLHELARQIEGR